MLYKKTNKKVKRSIIGKKIKITHWSKNTVAVSEDEHMEIAKVQCDDYG